MKTFSVDSFSSLDPTLYEEDSYYFLDYYQKEKDWYVYDSHELGLNTVKHLADNFCAFHGKVPFPNQTAQNQTFWSSVPLGVFKYKLLSDMSCGLVLPANKVPGYIVSGVYWDNGFSYVVLDNSEIIQIKLYVDQYTKRTRQYPELSYL